MENFTSKTTKNILSKSPSKKIFQSSASYKIGSENNPHPSYPLLARKKGWEGRVIIQANIDKKGNVKFIKVSESSGFKVLDDVSVETLKRGNLNRQKKVNLLTTQFIFQLNLY